MIQIRINRKTNKIVIITPSGKYFFHKKQKAIEFLTDIAKKIPQRKAVMPSVFKSLSKDIEACMDQLLSPYLK